MPTELPKHAVMSMPMFADLVAPNGFLDTFRESHALWYYYGIARNAYDTIVVDAVVMEGDVDPTCDFRQMFIGVARAYGVDPEAMAKCLPQVDMQASAQN